MALTVGEVTEAPAGPMLGDVIRTVDMPQGLLPPTPAPPVDAAEEYAKMAEALRRIASSQQRMAEAEMYRDNASFALNDAVFKAAMNVTSWLKLGALAQILAAVGVIYMLVK